MNFITHKPDLKRIFEEMPLPDKYNNPQTKIEIFESAYSMTWKIFATNPYLPPIELNTKTKKWKELKPKRSK